MRFEDLMKFFVYSKMHEQGYPAEGYEVQIDGETVWYFEDSQELKVYAMNEDVILELESRDSEITVPVHVFKVTREEVTL
jgi:hypothetical protein